VVPSTRQALSSTRSIASFAEIIRNSGAGGSATKIVEDVASSLREKRDPVENSVKATKKATLSSRVNGLREPAERVIAHFKSWRISTPATAARTVPIVTTSSLMRANTHRHLPSSVAEERSKFAENGH